MTTKYIIWVPRTEDLIKEACCALGLEVRLNAYGGYEFKTETDAERILEEMHEHLVAGTCIEEKDE